MKINFDKAILYFLPKKFCDVFSFKSRIINVFFCGSQPSQFSRTLRCWAVLISFIIFFMVLTLQPPGPRPLLSWPCLANSSAAVELLQVLFDGFDVFLMFFLNRCFSIFLKFEKKFNFGIIFSFQLILILISFQLAQRSKERAEALGQTRPDLPSSPPTSLPRFLLLFKD